MRTPMQQWPALVVTTGPEAGRSFTIARGSVTLGRADDADIVLRSTSVSRRHARILRDGEDVLVEDAGSTNGTYLNGDKVVRPTELEVGDTVRVGDFELQFGVIGMPAPRHGEGPASSFDFGDVDGPVNAGNGAMNVGSGQQYVVDGDVHTGDRFDIEVGDLYPGDEMFEGKGFGRFLAIVGIIVALTGFAIFASVIFSGFGATSPDTNPFDSEIAGFPKIGLGFTMFAVGGLVAGLGQSMSRAARRREERAQREARRRHR